MKVQWLSVLAVVFSPISIAQPPADDIESIRALRAESNAAIARHDVAAFRSFLSGDFVVSISTGEIDRSRDGHARAIAEHFEQYPDVIYVRKSREIQISDAYPLAIESGEWTGSRTTATGRLENGGRYTAAWRKTGDGWKIYSELYVALYCRGPGCEK